MATMESKLRTKLKNDIEEEFKKDYGRKEKLLNLNFKKKIEQHKATL